MAPVVRHDNCRVGIAPLEDQQLAGLVMWVPAGLIFTGGGLVFFVAWLRESDRRAAFGSLLLVVGLAIAASHCRSREDQLVQVREGLQSLEATLTATATAWLDRNLSSREAYTVLERTYHGLADCVVRQFRCHRRWSRGRKRQETLRCL